MQVCIQRAKQFVPKVSTSSKPAPVYKTREQILCLPAAFFFKSIYSKLSLEIQVFAFKVNYLLCKKKNVCKENDYPKYHTSFVPPFAILY